MVAAPVALIALGKLLDQEGQLCAACVPRRMPVKSFPFWRSWGAHGNALSISNLRETVGQDAVRPQAGKCL